MKQKTTTSKFKINIFFNDFFNIPEKTIKDYGAFNLSLINDLPLFIDPFLLFSGKDPQYTQLHDDILKYLTFLKDKSETGSLTPSEIKSWYSFSEVKQNWLGFSVSGNGGLGLGKKFGKTMSSNMYIVYEDLNKETITSSSHLEKVGLFEIGIGKDNISDFTCNLIKGYLLKYTETFAKTYLKSDQVHEFMINKSYFDYKLEKWMPQKFTLPTINGDYVILTPRDILTKDETWINGHELRGDFLGICNSIDNAQLRGDINRYFRSKLPAPASDVNGRATRKRPTQKEHSEAVLETIKAFPKVLNYYIKQKEENKVGAEKASSEKVSEVEELLMKNVITLVTQLLEHSKFYDITPKTSYEEALKRANFLKDVIEKHDGYRLFYYQNKPIKREADLQVIYKLTWYTTPFDVNREPNNGRGPVDYSVSLGSKDKTLVEFKLASNKKLYSGIEKQVKIYEKANNTDKTVIVILYFDNSEYLKVKKILEELKLEKEKSIVLIDAGHKLSASVA